MKSLFQTQCIVNVPEKGGLIKFKNPLKRIVTSQVEEVSSLLAEVEAVCQNGFYAVGFVAYEASAAFDSAFQVDLTSAMGPLLDFTIYEGFELTSLSDEPEEGFKVSQWKASQEWAPYQQAILRIKNAIAEGDTYQVNYTFKLNGSFEGSARSFFLEMQQGLKAEYAFFMETDTQTICSFSPELFIERRQGQLIGKPMKGTASRGLYKEEDEAKREALFRSAKNRAENVMIVDMIRNDMGRVADIGTVRVESCFDIERHPYVFQMTSKVVSNCNAALPDLFKALFPCASITGAPKVRTMRIIHELEKQPRGIYTGCMGIVEPSGDFRFNVGIRTLNIDKANGSAQYGVGSGIVWDSDARSEYEECLLKADFLTRAPAVFELLESILWEPESGYYLLEEHLYRMKASADYFGFAFDRERILKQLISKESQIPTEGAKVRLLLDSEGSLSLEIGTLKGVNVNQLNVGIALNPVPSDCVYLYHKTTQREIYQKALADRPDCDDLILWNEKGEITESCRANVVIERGGVKLTPPVNCGLLGGTFRSYLLKKGELKEAVITKEELINADRLYLINSVRKWMEVKLLN